MFFADSDHNLKTFSANIGFIYSNLPQKIAKGWKLYAHVMRRTNEFYVAEGCRFAQRTKVQVKPGTSSKLWDTIEQSVS